MVGEDRGAPDGQDAFSSSSSVSSSYDWKKRVFIPAVVAGVVGSGVGLVSNHRKTLGLANVSASYAANFAIVTGCYCGAREFVIATRKTGPDDLLNSAIAGFGTGALLGRLQGGQLGAAKYSAILAIAGTTADFAFLKLKSVLRDYNQSVYQDDENSQKIGSGSWLRLPEWFPIQVLDEEALAEKRAQQEKFLAQQARIRNLRKEES
ncbi:uncharacterized protein LOC114724786 isoform X1 [Neltuma alba]|uniref:uncharacterized protein LOC114724786 isoform X1 n=1 Tax=Neltuma alba TaxID=207710 RepID=UPI0010A4A532|nr:uncharacterized protein LOC114724786 isoform X1 [Prosopis alba]